MAQEKKKNTKTNKQKNENKIVPAKNTTKKVSTKKTTVKKTTKTPKNTKKEIELKEVKNDELDIVKVDLSSENKDEYYDILEQEKSHIFIKFLVIVLVLAIGIFVIYKFVIRDQKAIFTSGINAVYEKLANNIVKFSNIDILKDNIEIDGVLSVSTTDKNHNDLNNYLYDLNLGINRNENKYKLLLNIKEQENTITTFNYYYLNNKYYLNLGNNYNKTISLNNNILDYDPSIMKYLNINYNKLNNSAKTIKNIINSNIDRNKLTKGEETIDNNTFEYVELSLNNEEYSNLVSNIIDNVKNNNNLMDTLSQAFNTNKDTILNTLEELQKNNLKNNFNNITFKFYTYGFMANIIGFEIKTDNNIVLQYFNNKENNKNDCTNCIPLTYRVILNYKDYNLYMDKNGNTYNCVIKKNDKDYLHLVFNEFTDNKVDVDYESYENNNHGNFHLESSNKDKSGNFKYSIIDKKNTTSINFDYRINNNVNININNYVDIDELSEDDYLTIGNNISKNIKNNDIRNKYKEIFEKIYNY